MVRHAGWVGFALLLTLLSPGCRKANRHAPAEGYEVRYRAIMAEYRDRTVELTSRPLPELGPSAPRREKLDRIADQLDEVAGVAARGARRLDTLSPPAKFRRSHAATRNLLQVSADGTRAWATAVRSGSRIRARRALRDAEAGELAAARELNAATEEIGLKVPAIEQLITELTAASR